MQYDIVHLMDEEIEGKPIVSSVLSFKPFIDFLRKKVEDGTSMKKEIYEMMLHKFASYPELEKEINVDEVQRYKHILDLIFLSLRSLIDDEQKLSWGLSKPVVPTIFYGTDSFYNMADKSCETFAEPIYNENEAEAKKKKLEMLYSFILERCYQLESTIPMVITRSLIDQTTGITSHFSVHIDTQFVEIDVLGELPPINIESLQEKMTQDNGIDILLRVLPLSLFRFRGFSIITVSDITQKHALSTVRQLVTNHSVDNFDDAFEKTSHALKSLLGTSKIELNILPLYRVNGKLVEDIDAYCHSILFSLGKQKGLLNNFFLPMIEQFIQQPRIIYFRDLKQKGPNHVQLAQLLTLAGIRSYALFPIYYNNKLVGAFEIYTSEANLLNENTFRQLEQAFPLVAQLVQNSLSEFENDIDRIIKTNFTSLQPAVQWRFNEAAWHYLYQERQKDSPKIDKIRFDKVYPIYGAIDIRNSTIERNGALQKDLMFQLGLLQSVLLDIQKENSFGLINELIFKCKQWEKLLNIHIETDDELRLNQFLTEEVLPFLVHFKDVHPALAGRIKGYIESTDIQEGDSWQHRRQLEDSMMSINTAINNYLDFMNIELQQAYPCYFDKFRTDGVEYDVYIGQSITPQKPFDLMYLKNVRLWQLRSMAAIARMTNGLLQQMPIPLQTTQLIFIYNNTIDISFRNDEHRFDVEGGYNIRYHIIKKRIDKVLIRNSNERLTQPGKIALVYFNPKDADEYVAYLKYLIAEGVVKDDLEYIELEELQGVTGLKALRISVNMEGVNGES